MNPKNLKPYFILLILCGISTNSWAGISDTIVIDLPGWQEPKGMERTDFSLGYGEINRSGWGKYSLNERKYFKDVLPSLFKKTLVLDSLTEDRGIKWIFTGPKAGFYIELNDNKFTFYTQYYDSFGLNVGKKDVPLYPRSEKDPIVISPNGKVRAITVELNYKLGLKISLNGQEVIKQTFMEDIRRNQIHLTGKKGTLDARILTSESIEAEVKVNPGKTYQEMLGWGGTTTPTAYNELSKDGKAKWWQYIKQYNMLCQREYPTGGALHKNLDNYDKLSDAKAHYYGDNFPNGEITDFGYNKKIQEMGGFVVFEFWDFPKWIGDDEDEYTRAIVGYCKQAKEKTGKAPKIVGVQNEINMSEEHIKKFVPALRKGLDKAGFSAVKIHMINWGSVGSSIERADKFIDNPKVWDVIDYSTTNEYDYQSFFTNPDGFDARLKEWSDKTGSKPFLCLELSVNSSKYQTDSYRVALTMGQLYQKNLTLADAVLIGYCWNLLNIEQPNFGATRSLFISSPENGFIPEPSSNQLRVFGAFSRRIKKGMTRIEVETQNEDLKVVAFKGADNKGTMVVLNRSLNPVNLKIDWAGVDFTEMETVDPYSPNMVKPLKGKEVKVAPGALVTMTNVPLNN